MRPASTGAPPAPARPPAGVIDYALLFGLAAAWGASFVLIKVGVETLPALSLTALRLIVASVLIVAVACAAGDRLPRSPAVWWTILSVALTGNVVPFALIAWGEERIDSAIAAILMAVMPLMTVLIAHLVTQDERITGGKMAGLLLGFAGLVLLIGPDRLRGLGEDTLRQLAVAGAAACYGLNAVLTKSLTGASQRAVAAAMTVVAALVLLAAALVVDGLPRELPSARSLAAVVTLGLVQTGVGTLVLFEIIRRQGASFFAQINFLVPVCGVAWSAFLLAERLPGNAIAALGLILAGVAIARARFRGTERSLG